MFMYFFNFNLFFIFVLLFSFTASFHLKDLDSKKIILNNVFQEHDLPADLKSQKIDGTYHLNTGNLETFTRHKRQLESPRRRPGSFRSQQLSQRSSFQKKQIGFRGGRKPYTREHERRKRLLKLRRDSIRISQAVTPIPRPVTRREKSRQQVADGKLLLDNDEFIDKLMDKIKEKARERTPPPTQYPPSPLAE